MRKRATKWFTLALCAFVVGCLSSARNGIPAAAPRTRDDTPHLANREPMTDTDSQRLIADLLSAPSWLALPMSADANQDAEKLLAVLRRVQKFAIPDVRALLVEFVRSVPDGTGRLDQVGKIFVLNRLLFNVPEPRPSRRVDRGHGGWFVPVYNGRPDMLWLLSFDHGQLKLTGRFVGYSGALYDPLREFDRFECTYGPRPLLRP